MRILMISPHPVYTPRGTPISVFNRCAALCALGHQVDLVTYPIGEDLPIEGLRYLRAAVPGLRHVAVGPSWAKLPLNAAVSLRALRQLVGSRGRYDVIHSHEEAGPVGWALSRAFRLPHVYDMGNDWAVVLQNYGLAARHPLTRLARVIERQLVAASSAVIAHFPSIAASIRSYGVDTPVEVIYNAALDAEPDRALVDEVRLAMDPDNRPVVLYAGTLERYQGIEALLEAVAMLSPTRTAMRLVIIGGRDEQVTDLRAEAARLGIADRVQFTGMLPPAIVPACLAAADALVSPRASGTNTPLKIFSYLRSGTPMIATEIQSHTQVLDSNTSVLVEPTAAGLAAGIRKLLADPEFALRIQEAALRKAGEHSVEAYVAGVARAYEHVGADPASPSELDAAAGRVAHMATGWGAPADIRSSLRVLAGSVEPAAA